MQSSARFANTGTYERSLLGDGESSCAKSFVGALVSSAQATNKNKKVCSEISNRSFMIKT